ncbi:hypothetical protein ANCDUO_02159 [Ancylostoma duodenale]|uniref:Costars domain-containing protein n=1 Tax=Ancylostoma duodenale TaxID=51022 RepID=A0A0C2DCD3_9BILA|nr:hypothetical protein ANCDUO_02159 [Ancylostoma duodenale]
MRKNCPPSVSDIGRVMLRFRELEKEEIESRKDDVYSKNYVPRRYSKCSAEYGTPKPGTLTEMRAKKASKHIAREMLYLCEVIREYGHLTKKGRIEITFGQLFSVYQYISDKKRKLLNKEARGENDHDCMFGAVKIHIKTISYVENETTTLLRWKISSRTLLSPNHFL